MKRKLLVSVLGIAAGFAADINNPVNRNIPASSLEIRELGPAIGPNGGPLAGLRYVAVIGHKAVGSVPKAGYVLRLRLDNAREPYQFVAETANLESPVSAVFVVASTETPIRARVEELAVDSVSERENKQ